MLRVQGSGAHDPKTQTQRRPRQARKHGLLPATHIPGATTIPAGVHYGTSRQDDVAVPGRHSSGVIAFNDKNHKPVPLILNTVHLPPAAPYHLDARSSTGALGWGSRREDEENEGVSRPHPKSSHPD